MDEVTKTFLQCMPTKFKTLYLATTDKISLNESSITMPVAMYTKQLIIHYGQKGKLKKCLT